jgi:hypothetical protein
MSKSLMGKFYTDCFYHPGVVVYDSIIDDKNVSVYDREIEILSFYDSNIRSCSFRYCGFMNKDGSTVKAYTRSQLPLLLAGFKTHDHYYKGFKFFYDSYIKYAISQNIPLTEDWLKEESMRNDYNNWFKGIGNDNLYCYHKKYQDMYGYRIKIDL